MTALNRRSKAVSWVAQVVVALILLQTLFFKFTGAEESVYIFEKLGLEPWGRIGSGIGELVASALLLLPGTAALGALLATGIIAGAIASHLTVLGIEVQGDGGLLFGLALVVLAGSLVVLWLRRAELPVVGGRFGGGAALVALLALAGAGAVAADGGGHRRYGPKPDEEALRQRLTALQYDVTQREGTEPPFRNEYWDNEEPGLYVDVVSGEPLFSSREKYHSGTGWPSFWAPLEPDNVVERVDRRLFFARTEVRSKHGDSHLGHVFTDGPAPSGLRYCLNSAALRFVPLADLEAEGYGEYLRHFADAD